MLPPLQKLRMRSPKARTWAMRIGRYYHQEYGDMGIKMGSGLEMANHLIFGLEWEMESMKNMLF